jgi:hypothetical protein
MIARNETVVFSKPFLLKGVDRILPAGSYRVVTDEELIEGISFPAYRRVSTMIFVPGEHGGSIEMLAIDPLDLRIALDKDTALVSAECRLLPVSSIDTVPPARSS